MSGHDDDWTSEVTVGVEGHLLSAENHTSRQLLRSPDDGQTKHKSRLLNDLLETSRERALSIGGLDLSQPQQTDMQTELDTRSENVTLTTYTPNESPDIQLGDDVDQTVYGTLLTSRYEDLGLLGSGGMGVVRRIRDRLLNRVLAMKVLHNRLLDEPAAVERFVQEAQVCAQLQHPNILPIHDLGVLDAGNLFITMTEIRGASFDTYIERVHAVSEPGHWNEGADGWNLFKLVGVFQGVCRAIAHAHDHNVVHRDLKPQNIMVCSEAEVLVVDWGLAKVLGADGVDEPITTARSENDANATVAGSIYGTPSYMAPELAAADRPAANIRTDIYALGTILYEVLRGQPAYTGRTAYDVLVQVALKPPPSFISLANPEDETTPREVPFVSARGAPLPAFLVNVCNKAMARNPDDRFESVHEMIELIGQWLDGSRRREEALELVDEGRILDTVIRDAEQQATRLSALAKTIGQTVNPWDSDESKRQMWALEDEAEGLTVNAMVNRVQQAQLFRSALAYKDDLPEAHTALATYYRDLHRQAEKVGDHQEMRRAEIILTEHVNALPPDVPLKKILRQYLEGHGQLSVRTEPSAAKLELIPLIKRDRRLVPGDAVATSTSPLENFRVDMGSYILRISLDGYHDTIYPVFNQRQDITDGRNPTGSHVAIRLLPQGVLGPDDCYVPTGWCWVGGDARTPNAGPSLKVWIDGFVIRRYPVTHGEYIEFLNDLVMADQEEAALLYVPREQSSSDEDLGAMSYQRNADGRFILPDDPERLLCWPNQPVTMIQWRAARAYASWLARRTGKPWRLPMEFEWEKAARGVDGRAYPWGDAFDPSWACMKDSHPDVVRMHDVHTFPHDESVYGVRGTAGNTRDWCLDRFRDTGPPLEEGRLLMPSVDDLADTGFKSTRGGSYGNSESRARSADRDWWFPDRSYVGRGFRIAWGLKDSEFSD